MNINKLYPNLKLNIEIYGVTNNPNKVKSNYLYVSTDNNKLNTKLAIKNGAVFIVTNKTLFLNLPHIKVNNINEEYIRLLKLYYHYKPIYTVGIIGMNGNDTVSKFLNNIFDKLSLTALISDNKIKYLDRCYKTSKPLDSLYPSYQIFNNHNIKHVTINIDTSTILNNELSKLDLNGIIFTNLNYRYSLKGKELYNYTYFNPKLYNNIKKGTLIVMNSDDLYSRYIPKYSKNKIITYGITEGYYRAKNIELALNNTSFDVYYKHSFLISINITLFGYINIYNVLSVIAYTNELGIPLDIIKEGIETLKDDTFSDVLLDNKVIEKRQLNNITPHDYKKTLIDIKNINKNRIISIIPSTINLTNLEKKDIGLLSTTFSDITIFICNNKYSELADLINNLNNKDYYICTNIEDAEMLAFSLYKNNDIILEL